MLWPGRLCHDPPSGRIVSPLSQSCAFSCVVSPTLLLVSLSERSRLLLACAVLPIWEVGEYPVDT